MMPCCVWKRVPADCQINESQRKCPDSLVWQYGDLQAEKRMIDRCKEKEFNFMLCLSLLPGEYLTIGDDVVLQYDCTSGDRCKLVIQAPREIPVLRGNVRERQGKERPGCVFDKSRWRKREIPWSRSKAQALTAMRRRLWKMDGSNEDVIALRRQLNHMFPPESEEGNDAPQSVALDASKEHN